MSTSTVGPGVARSNPSAGILETKKDWTATIKTKQAVKHGSKKFKGLESDADGRYASVVTEPTEDDDSFENEVISMFYKEFITPRANTYVIIWVQGSNMIYQKIQLPFRVSLEKNLLPHIFMIV